MSTRRETLFFNEFYATAQLTPKAVPTAANIAEARFHRNLISLDLFSLVIIFQFFNISIFQYFIWARKSTEFLSTDYHRLIQIFGV